MNHIFIPIVIDDLGINIDAAMGAWGSYDEAKGCLEEFFTADEDRWCFTHYRIISLEVGKCNASTIVESGSFEDFENREEVLEEEE